MRYPTDTFQLSINEQARYRIDTERNYSLEIVHQLYRALEPMRVDQLVDALFSLFAEAARWRGNLNQ